MLRCAVRTLLAVFALMLIVSPDRPAHAFSEKVESFTLDNGMMVVTIPDHRAPVVTHMVWYRAGAADEPVGKSGIAHFVEHLMFKGTEELGPGEFSRIVRRHGGQDNAFTSYDYTGYFQRIHRDLLGMVMEMEADRMLNLTFPEEEVRTERLVILEERSQRVDNDPSSLLSEQMSAVLFINHPYGTPVIGWRQEMETLSRDDALDFYRTHYTPANAILIVAGDVTADEVRELADTHYGRLENIADPQPRVRPRVPSPEAARRVVLEDPTVSPPHIRRTYLAAAGREDDGTALELLAEIIGGNTTSILYQRLVVERNLASQAGAYYSGQRLDYGVLGVYAVPAPGVGLNALEAALDEELAAILEDGITDERLADAQNDLIARTVYALDSQQHLARVFGVALTTGATVEDVQDWPNRVASATVDEVVAAAHSYIDAKRSVTGALIASTEDLEGREAAPDAAVTEVPGPEDDVINQTENAR